MDPILQVLLSWQFVLFGLAIAAVMYILRIIVEYVFLQFKIDPKKPLWWNDLLLPILPVIFGPIASLYFKSFPYPDGLTSHGDRLIFGLVAGLLSTLLYRVVKSLLVKEVQGVAQVFPGVVPAPLLPGPVVPVVPATTTTTVTVSTPDPTTPPMMEDHNLPPRGQV